MDDTEREWRALQLQIVWIETVRVGFAQDTNPHWFSNQYHTSDSRYTPKLCSCCWNRRALDAWLNARTCHHFYCLVMILGSTHLF